MGPEYWRCAAFAGLPDFDDFEEGVGLGMINQMTVRCPRMTEKGDVWKYYFSLAVIPFWYE